VVSAVRKLVRRAEVSPERVELAFEDLDDLAVRRWPHHPLLPRVWALRHALSPYDAAYLALAEALGASLVTLDAGLATVASGSVRVVASYAGRSEYRC